MMKGRCRMLTSRLLILNQKEAECKEMAAYFQDSGYSVIWCTEYDEATEILSRGKNKPDLLIFDVDLPKRREYEALEKIRSLSDMAVLMLSQDDKLDSQLYAYSKKIDDYMVKPAPLPLLEAHVEAVIRRTAEKRNPVESVGAEKLLGKGDMLFYPAGYSKPVRVQGAFISCQCVGNWWLLLYLLAANSQCSFQCTVV